MNYLNRLHKLQQHLLSRDLSGMVVSRRENIAYLTGLHQIHPTNREAILLVTPTAILLYHSPFLSPPPVVDGVAMDTQHPPTRIIPDFFQLKSQISHSNLLVAIESADYTVAEKNRLKTLLPQADIADTTDVVETFRLLKDADEIELLRRAGRLTAKLMKWTIELVTHPPANSLTEIDVSHRIESRAYDLGADSLAFPPVVAFGSHTASPHHPPGKRRVGTGPVLLDLGVSCNGYASDMTRTIYLGSPLPLFRKIEHAVKSAYQSAFSLLPSALVLTKLNTPAVTGVNNPGVNPTAASLDRAARDIITQAGFGKNFIHTTGHGLGLEIHEAPSLNSSNNQKLKPGMAITIEPGIYLPRKFGYRHENTLLLE